MTVISSQPCEEHAPAIIDRVALRLGLALVAWARRPATRPQMTRELAQLRHEADRATRELLIVRDAARGIPGIR